MKQEEILKQTAVWVRNPHGIAVRKWCASCRHKQQNDFGTRVCALKGVKTRKGYVCDEWEMSASLEAAGAR